MRYKLTDENGKTYRGCEWGPGVSHSASGTGELCSTGWIHVYDSPWVAVMMNSYYADFENPRLWECEVSGNELNDHGLKRGVQKCMTVREIPMPVLTTEQRVEIAIRCALHGCTDDSFTRWAERWLDGTNRSIDMAWAAWTVMSEKTIGSDTSAVQAAAEAAWGAAKEAACCGGVLEAVGDTALSAELEAAWMVMSEKTIGSDTLAVQAAVEAARETVWTAASKAVWAAALNAEIDIAAVIEEVIGDDRNAQIIEEGNALQTDR